MQHGGQQIQPAMTGLPVKVQLGFQKAAAYHGQETLHYRITFRRVADFQLCQSGIGRSGWRQKTHSRHSDFQTGNAQRSR